MIKNTFKEIRFNVLLKFTKCIYKVYSSFNFKPYINNK